MKQIIFTILFALPVLAARAQGEQDSTASASLSASDSASFYYGNSRTNTNTNFTVQHAPVAFHRVFRVNSAKTAAEVYDRALGFARMVNVNYREDREKKAIYIPFTWQYSGGFNECIEDLDLKGELVLEVKDLKTRISLQNLTYVHHDKDDNAVKPVAKTDFFNSYPDCAPAKGKIELLYNCTDCSRSTRSLNHSLQAQFDNLANQYQERLKKY